MSRSRRRAAGGAAGLIVEGVQTTQSNNNSDTSVVIDLPAGITAGDIIIVATTLHVERTVTWPSPWVELHDVTSNSNDRIGFSVGYLVASGGETSVTLTSSASTNAVSIAYRISGGQGAPESAISAGANSNTASPPVLSPSWGSAKTLWLALEGNSRKGTAISYPSGYGDTATIAHSVAESADAVRVSGAALLVETATETPGAFVITSGTAPRNFACTVAVRPA